MTTTSWNNGIEGLTDDAAVVTPPGSPTSRRYFATLFVTRGTVMLTAGDEAAWRSQRGNNNAYAQDNERSPGWTGKLLSPIHRPHRLSGRCASASRSLRRNHFFHLTAARSEWLSPLGDPMRDEDWDRPDATTFAMVLVKTLDRRPARRFVWPSYSTAANAIPLHLEGRRLKPLGVDFGVPAWLPPRSVVFYVGAPRLL